MYEQDRFVVRLRQRLSSERTIIAAWFFGSFGRNVADPYSDLNICLVYRDENDRAAAWAQRREFGQSILAYVSAKSVDSAENQHSVLFDSGTLAHFRYESQTSLRPSPADREIKILKDRSEGWAMQYQQQCQFASLQMGMMTTSTMVALDDQFWVQFWNVYRQIRRGATQTSFAGYIHLLASTVPPLLQALPLEHAAYQALIAAQFSRDARATLAHLRQLLSAYLAARSAVVAKYRLDFRPNSTFERNIERALKK